MTIEEFSKYANFARQTIYGLISENQIPFHKSPMVRKLYFVKPEIDEWLTSNRSVAHVEVKFSKLKQRASLT